MEYLKTTLIRMWRYESMMKHGRAIILLYDSAFPMKLVFGSLLIIGESS